MNFPLTKEKCLCELKIAIHFFDLEDFATFCNSDARSILPKCRDKNSLCKRSKKTRFQALAQFYNWCKREGRLENQIYTIGKQRTILAIVLLVDKNGWQLG